MKKLRYLILSLISVLMFTPLQSFAAEDYLAYVWDSSNNKWVNALAYQIDVVNDTKEVKAYVPQGYINLNNNDRDNVYFLYASANITPKQYNSTYASSRAYSYDTGQVRTVYCGGRAHFVQKIATYTNGDGSQFDFYECYCTVCGTFGSPGPWPEWDHSYTEAVWATGNDPCTVTRSNNYFDVSISRNGKTDTLSTNNYYSDTYPATTHISTSATTGNAVSPYQQTQTVKFTTLKTNDSTLTISGPSRTWTITIDIDGDGKVDYSNSGTF